MKLTVSALIAVSLIPLASQARSKAKAKAKEGGAAHAASAQASTGAEPPASAEANQKAMALPVAQFEEAALYTITTTVGGEEVALTFILPTGDIRPGTLTTNGSKAKVELHKLTGAPEQVWQPKAGGIEPPGFLIFNKVSDAEDRLSGILVLYNPDMRFIDADEYHAKYNRPTVSYHNGGGNEYWYIAKLENGKYKIMSRLGHPTQLNKPGESWGEKWNETRWLEAVKEGGKVKLRHRRASDAPGQEWTFTKVGTYFKG